MYPPSTMLALRIGLDLGTAFTRIAFQHLHSDKTTRTAKVEDLVLPTSDNRETCGIKQVALYKGDGTLIWGKDVNDAVRSDSNLQNRVLEMSNLALHSNFDLVAEVIHVKDVLNVEKEPAALENFFKDLLGCIARDVRDVFKDWTKYGNELYTDSYWDSIPLEFEIGVPAMWGDVQANIIRNSARKAGIASVELHEGTLCVATEYLLDQFHWG
jgi:hypothetical protein